MRSWGLQTLFNLPLPGVTAGGAQKTSPIQGCHMDQWVFWHLKDTNTYTQGLKLSLRNMHCLRGWLLMLGLVHASQLLWSSSNVNLPDSIFISFCFIFLMSFSAKCFPSLYTGAWALPMLLSNLSMSPALSLLSAQMAKFEELNNFISPAVWTR